MKRGIFLGVVLVCVFGAGFASAEYNLVRNGSFETGDFTTWLRFPGSGFPVVQSATAPDGTYAVQVGNGMMGSGTPGVTAALTQLVLIPSYATYATLRMRYRVVGSDSPGYDWLKVEINSTTAGFWEADTAGWVTLNYSLDPWIGSLITLRISSWAQDAITQVDYYVDNVQILTDARPRRAKADLDGDGISDYGCYDPVGRYGQPSGSWFFDASSKGLITDTFGYPGTVPIYGDFDGDGLCDYGCYDAAGGYGQLPGSWFLQQSGAGLGLALFGYAGTIPFVGDFDGDGHDDYGCYDPVGRYGQLPGSWFVMRSSGGLAVAQFGYPGTIPVVGDVNRDRRDDLGLYDPNGGYGQPPGSWFLNINDVVHNRVFGYFGTTPIPMTALP